MTIVVTSPVTGGAQTGLTSPTFTLTADTPPSINARQQAVTALGGTQPGVLAHSVASPFTITTVKPASFKVLGKANPVTGVISAVPKNSYSVLTRKGVIPLAGQPSQVMPIRTTFDIPAGADLADATSVRAALSLHIGALQQVSAGLGDTLVTGVM